jgi:hypothetical protein
VIYVPSCHTIYHTQYEQKCDTSYVEKCSTDYETKYVTVHEKKCQVHHEEVCEEQGYGLSSFFFKKRKLKFRFYTQKSLSQDLLELFNSDVVSGIYLGFARNLGQYWI